MDQFSPIAGLLSGTLPQAQYPHPDMLTDEDLSRLPFNQLALLRDKYKDQIYQDRIAPYEHRAFAREAVGKNPLLAPLMALGAPAYQLSKIATAGWGSRTGPSLEQMHQGLYGTGEGFVNGLKGLMQ